MNRCIQISFRSVNITIVRSSSHTSRLSNFSTSTLKTENSPRMSTTNTNNNDLIQIIFLRHGQSTWNQQNIFIGMTDTYLTKDGEKEAIKAGQILADAGIQIDMVFTSLLRRSINTVWHVLTQLSNEWLPVVKDWRLNERNYGALVGRNKKQCVEEYGKDQVKRWRRSWDEPPPQMTPDNQYWPFKDRRYEALGITEEMIPAAESLKDVTKRTSVFWDEIIVPQLRLKKRIMIVGHENNLRSIIKRLDSISDDDIINLELPRAIPLVYQLDPITLRPVPQSSTVKESTNYASESLLTGRYLVNKVQLERIAERDQQQAPFLGVMESNDISKSTTIPSR
eukprot:gene14683-19725_t